MVAGEIESLLGAAIARMELARRDTLLVFEDMYPQMIDPKTRSEWLKNLMMPHMRLEYAASDLLKVVSMLNPDATFTPRDFGHSPRPARLDIQNPINKVLLEALRRLASVVDIPESAGVMKFARQAISEAEKGLGGNLGSPVPESSNTEVRRDSLLITLRDIQNELGAYFRDTTDLDAIARAYALVTDVLDEGGLGENLGSPAPKGSNTEVRVDSLLQTLRDILAEAENPNHSALNRVGRIAELVADVLAKAEGR
jgi:hypothetical protein